MSYSIGEIQAILDDMPVQRPTPAGGAEANVSRFATWFEHELSEVNGTLVKAEQGVQQLAAGGTANVHEVMINLEEARLSLQMAVQVRNRVLEAYQEVMRTQV